MMKTFTKFLRSIPQVYTFPSLLLGAILVIIILLHPTVSSWWNKSSNSQKLSTFITQLQKDQTTDVKQFWEFRERYSPGFTLLNEEAVGVYQNYRIEQVASDSATHLLEYQSPLIESTDSITQDRQAIKKLVERIPEEAEILIQNDTLLLAKIENDGYDLAFLAPIEQMRAANGFFDYLPQEQKLLENSLWLNTTFIRIQ